MLSRAHGGHRPPGVHVACALWTPLRAATEFEHSRRLLPPTYAGRMGVQGQWRSPPSASRAAFNASINFSTMSCRLFCVYAYKLQLYSQ
ncbi:hypothetical protein ZWY2020_014785 [Hordeum vulgare]|nr:hypothetical protein ZWY2020_014785 [Hordeum vulgare]